MVNIPHVAFIQMGTRDMARWLRDCEQLKAARPDRWIITCHDEYSREEDRDVCEE